jgi:SAM-dependent methyltransferase
MQPATQTSLERACPACGGRSYTPFADERIDPRKISDFTYASRKQPEFMCLRLIRCTDCDLVYAPTPPATDFLSTAYSQAAYDSGPEAQAAARSYAKALAPYVARLAGRSAAVDVGAGSGPLLPWLTKNGFSTVIGIEPSRAAIEAAPPAVRPMLREGMFSPALLADVRPSLLCSFMTLEHLADPGGFVGAAYEILEPGGMLAVVVHNWCALLNRLLGLRSPIIDMEHLQLFSPQSVRTLLARAGFVSIDQQAISNAYPLRYWLRLTPLPAGIKTRIAVFLDQIGLSDTQIPLRVGNMLAVGYKPLMEQQ